MKKKLLLPLSTLLLAGIALTSCSTFKQDLEKRKKDSETEPAATEMSETTEAEASDVTETEETTTEETTEATTEDTTPVEPSIVTIESNVYTAAEAPIVVDWDNYQAQGAKPADSNKFTRYSDEYIDGFTPMEDYGAVFPYLATTSHGSVANSDFSYFEDDYAVFDSYGLCDSQGRIICDPMFSDVRSLYCSGNLVLEVGEYPEKKMGLINPAGTKYTQLVYDHINANSGGIYARSGNTLTVYDEELNVVMRTPFNINYDSFKYGDVESYDIDVYRVIDQEHCIIDLGQDVRYVLNTATGEVAADQFIIQLYNDPNIKADHNDEGYYLADLSGNRISDIYNDYKYTESYPIFTDASGKSFGLDSQGQVIKEFGKLDAYTITNVGDYLLVISPTGPATLYDKDFNEIATTSDSNGHSTGWSPRPITAPYIKDGDNIINGLTGEVAIENAKTTSVYYSTGDYVVAVGFSSGTTYILPGNRKIETGKNKRSNMPYDTVTETPYIIVFDTDHIDVYNVKTDKTSTIDASFSQSYPAVIRNGVLYIRSYNTTKLYDLNSGDEIFSFTASDPTDE